jgi:hypothetical protein
MENSLCEKPERHAPRRLSDYLMLEGQKQKVHSLVDKVSHEKAAHGVQAGQPCRTNTLASDRESPFIKAGCGKTACPVCAADGGEPFNRRLLRPDRRSALRRRPERWQDARTWRPRIGHAAENPVVWPLG